MSNGIKFGHLGLSHTLLHVAGFVVIAYFLLSALAVLVLFPVAFAAALFGKPTRRRSPSSILPS